MFNYPMFEITQAKEWTDEEVIGEARAWGYEGTDLSGAHEYLMQLYDEAAAGGDDL